MMRGGGGEDESVQMESVVKIFCMYLGVTSVFI
jgi:hypothetical protein